MLVLGTKCLVLGIMIVHRVTNLRAYEPTSIRAYEPTNMTGHYIHLLSNHFPIVSAIIGFGILTYALLSHNNTIKKVGLCILIFASLATIPAYLSGEEAEHLVEEFAGVSHSSIELHEEYAERTFYALDLLGIMSFVSLLLMMNNHTWSKTMNRLTWLIALVSIIMLFGVGKTGGEIRRPELQSTTSAQVDIKE